MALTRKMLKAMDLDEDKVSQIIDAHQSTIDEIAEERDKLKAEVEKYKGDFLTKPMKYGMINLVDDYNYPRVVGEKERIKQEKL